MEDGRYGVFELTGFPRVADVQAGDFNGDGKPDLLVGAFGWRSTGFIGLLANRTESYAQPSFETARLDERTGTIHVVPTDLNKDGRLDFVALISQQHETVVAYLNNGAGFTQETLYTAPHPNWGSSGMQLVDFDRDGDLDVLVTNGDSFDDFLLKPYHGIQWLENEGRLSVHRAPAGAAARAHTARWRSISIGTGIWTSWHRRWSRLSGTAPNARCRQSYGSNAIGPKTFTRHTLEVGSP